MRTLLGLVLVLSIATAQTPPAARQESPRKDPPRAYRFPVRHADPYLIGALLQGIPVLEPEISTILGFAGLPTPPSGAFRLLPPGRIFVNPTDNAIWFIPEN
ncbi:MAG TPA: hypothetical protein PLH94_12455 [Fimbriimonadaceae bacterium]|nr:hypothetical protein [Fimbriimonadaceae bacterium]